MQKETVHLQWFIFLWLTNRCDIIFIFIFYGKVPLGEISLGQVFVQVDNF